jgi:hypothetical protein
MVKYLGRLEYGLKTSKLQRPSDLFAVKNKSSERQTQKYFVYGGWGYHGIPTSLFIPKTKTVNVLRFG